MERFSQRKADEIRKVTITKNFIPNATGSALIECGNTKVICTATITNTAPQWMKGSGHGWLTAEYGMLPASSSGRINRDKHLSSGRTKEIQRLIGRSLRAAVELESFGEKTILIDCDVIQADGGTRTASLNGAITALSEALIKLRNEGIIEKSPMKEFMGAISVGLIDGETLVDLDYHEDSRAQVDMNVVMLGCGKFIEIQGTAEKDPFDRNQLDKMLGCAEKGINEIIEMQNELFENDMDWLLNR